MNKIERAAKDFRRHLKLNRTIYILGDGQGNIEDASYPNRYYVRFKENGPIHSMPANPNANIPYIEGIPVEVVEQPDGTLLIEGAYLHGVIRSGIDARTLNPLNKQKNYFINQSRVINLACTVHPDRSNKPLYVYVYPGIVVIDDEFVFFYGDELSLSGHLPSASERNVCLIFLKSDGTLEATSSTAKNMGLSLTTSDFTEAFNNRSEGSILLWAWELTDNPSKISNDPKKNMDLRQFINLDTSAGSSRPVMLWAGI